MVVTSSTVGNTMKSSGLTVYRLVSSTITASAKLKLKNMSSTTAGFGWFFFACFFLLMIGAASARVLVCPTQAGYFRLFMLYPRLVLWPRLWPAPQDGADRVQAARRVHPEYPDARRRARDSCAAGTRKPALRPPPCTALPEFRRPTRYGWTARAPAPALRAAAPDVRRPARGSWPPLRRRPWPPLSARPSCRPRISAPPRSESGLSPPRRLSALPTSCGGAPSRAAAAGSWP